jgi:Cu(I)/Ag(I) efflux system membrane protein CusA/SilA
MLVLILVYVNTRSLPNTLSVLLAIPFSAVGAIWFVWALGALFG